LWSGLSTQLLPPSLILLLISSLVENGTINLLLNLDIKENLYCLYNFISTLRNNLTLNQRSLYEIPKNSYQFKALIGLLLGDGHIHKNKN